MAITGPDCKISVWNSFGKSRKYDVIEKLWSETLDTKKNELFIKSLNIIGPIVEPWGTPDIIL